MTRPITKLNLIKERNAEESRHPDIRVRVGMATCGISAGADSVYEAFKTALTDEGLTDSMVISTGCVGRCDLEPMAEVTRTGEPPVLYIRLDNDKVKRIVKQHLVEGKIVEEFAG